MDVSSDARQQQAKLVIRSYQEMRESSLKVSVFKQDKVPRTATGQAAAAYATFKGAIVVWDAYFLGNDSSYGNEYYAPDWQRAGTLVHELAHYAIDAGHNSGTTATGGIDFGSSDTSCKDADTLESFAVTITTGS